MILYNDILGKGTARPNEMQTIVQTLSGLAVESNSSAAKIGQKHINCLTSIRIFPAIIVIVFHAGEHFTCIRGCLDWFAVTQVMSFFFVLSGFILTLNYPRIDGWKAALSFYLARVARVWPAHAICLILLIALIPEAFKLTAASLPKFIANITLTHAWIPRWESYFSFNAPSWSNSTDMFFYLTFPLLLFGLRDKRGRWIVFGIVTAIAVSAIAMCNVLRLPEFSPTQLSNQAVLYVQPLTRMLEFVIGMFAAFVFGKTLPKFNLSTANTTVLEVTILVVIAVLNVMSAAIRVAAVPFIGEPGGYWLQNSGLPVLGFAALFMCLATEKGLVAKSLSSKTLVLWGEVSFAVYMLHSVMLAHHGINYATADGLADFLLYVAVLCVSAHLLWKLAERPLRQVILSIGSSWLKLQSAARKHPSVLSKMNTGRSLIWLAAECVLLGLLIYFSLPTVNRVSPARAEQSAPLAQVRDVAYLPFLKLKTAVATKVGNSVSLELIWESIKPQSPNFLIVADVLDNSGQVTGHISYMQDMRFAHVNSGDLWIERANLDVPNSALTKYVSLKLLQRKRNAVNPSSSALPGPQPQTILIPIN